MLYLRRWFFHFLAIIKPNKEIAVIRSSSNDYLYYRGAKIKVVCDIGCADDADLSAYFLRGGAQVVGVDPTKLHAHCLNELSKSSENFTFLPLAISNKGGPVDFFHDESKRSGSLYSSHTNNADKHEKYTVQAVTLEALLKLIDMPVDYLKIDIEGAELGIFKDAIFSHMPKQVFIEFHPHAIPRYDWSSMRWIIRSFKEHKYKIYTRDGINYLFYHG